MKVKDLMEYLEDMDPDLEVVFAYGSGDYWGSIVTNEINDVVEKWIGWDEYHRKFAPHEEEPEWNVGYPRPKMAVVLE